MDSATPPTQPAPEIDSKQLSTAYKRNGAFDKQRKQFVEDVRQSETYARITRVIEARVRERVAEDPSVLSKNKGKMAALIQGEIIADPEVVELMEKEIRRRVFTAKESHDAVYAGLDDVRRTLLGLPSRADDVNLERKNRLSKTKGGEKVDLASLY